LASVRIPLQFQKFSVIGGGVVSTQTEGTGLSAPFISLPPLQLRLLRCASHGGVGGGRFRALLLTATSPTPSTLLRLASEASPLPSANANGPCSSSPLLPPPSSPALLPPSSLWQGMSERERRGER
jgi:hypothetical protein